MRVAEFAKLRGVNVRTAIRWLDDGIVKGGKVGGLWMVDDEVLLAPSSSVPIPAVPIVPATTTVTLGGLVETAFQKKAREDSEEAELLEIEARKAEAAKRIHAAKIDILADHENELTERENDLNDRQKNLDLLNTELCSREKAIAEKEATVAKLVDDANKELELRKSDIAKNKDEHSVGADKLIKDAEDKAKAIVKDATAQAGNFARQARGESDKLDARSRELEEQKVELDKGQLKLTAELAVVQRCMSRLDRDVAELALYPTKEWSGRIKTLIEFVKGELK